MSIEQEHGGRTLAEILGVRRGVDRDFGCIGGLEPTPEVPHAMNANVICHRSRFFAEITSTSNRCAQKVQIKKTSGANGLVKPLDGGRLELFWHSGYALCRESCIGTFQDREHTGRSQEIKLQHELTMDSGMVHGLSKKQKLRRQGSSVTMKWVLQENAVIKTGQDFGVITNAPQPLQARGVDCAIKMVSSLGFDGTPKLGRSTEPIKSLGYSVTANLKRPTIILSRKIAACKIDKLVYILLGKMYLSAREPSVIIRLNANVYFCNSQLYQANSLRWSGLGLKRLCLKRGKSQSNEP